MSKSELQAKQLVRVLLTRQLEEILQLADESTSPKSHFSTILAGLCSMAQTWLKSQNMNIDVELIDKENGAHILHGAKVVKFNA